MSQELEQSDSTSGASSPTQYQPRYFQSVYTNGLQDQTMQMERIIGLLYEIRRDIDALKQALQHTVNAMNSAQ